MATASSLTLKNVQYAVQFVYLLVAALLTFVRALLLPSRHHRLPKLPKSGRIAIVGGGIAGVGAAYSLKLAGYEHVTLYEARATVGGNAKTHEWNIGKRKAAAATNGHSKSNGNGHTNGNGTSKQTDDILLRTGLSVLAWPKIFHSYASLLDKLNVPTVEVDLPFMIKQSFSTSGSTIYAHALHTRCTEQYSSDLIKWQHMVNTVTSFNNFFHPTAGEQSLYAFSLLNPMNVIPLKTLARYYRVSNSFWQQVVVPLYSSTFLTIRLDSVPATIIPIVDNLISVQPTKTPRMFTWTSNSADVFDKMLVGVDVRTSHAVQRVSVQKVSSGRVAIGVDDDPTTYDRIIFACDAQAAANALTRGNAAVPRFATIALEHVSYCDSDDTTLTDGIIHSDSRVLPAGLRDTINGQFANFVNVSDDGHGQLSYHNTFVLSTWLPNLKAAIKQHQLDAKGVPSMYVTYNPSKADLANIDPKQIYGTVDNRRAHPSMNYRNTAISLLSRLFNGSNGVYFCGNAITPANGHNLSLDSGLAAADHIGAPYPFTDNQPAARDFVRLKRLLGY